MITNVALILTEEYMPKLWVKLTGQLADTGGDLTPSAFSDHSTNESVSTF